MFQLYLFVVFCLTLAAQSVKSECPKIKTWTEWGGKKALAVEYQRVPVKYVIVHFTTSSNCSNYSECSQQVANIQHYDMSELGWNDIGYNFLIDSDGNVYEGVGWNKIGAHTVAYDSRSIGVAFMISLDDEIPTEKALQAARRLLDCGVEKEYLAKNYILRLSLDVVLAKIYFSLLDTFRYIAAARAAIADRLAARL